MRKLKKNEKQLTDSYRICLYCGEDEVEKIGHDYEHGMNVIVKMLNWKEKLKNKYQN